MNNVVLGIDQSLTNTGVCIITSAGTCCYRKISPKCKGSRRLHHIFTSLSKLVKAHTPRLIVMEGYSMDSLNKPFALGEVGGVIRLISQLENIPLYVIPPSSLKKFVTGSGASPKEAIMATYMLEDNDLADARGLAEIGRSILLDTFTSRAQLEVLEQAKADPENIIAKKKASRPVTKKVYQAQMVPL